MNVRQHRTVGCGRCREPIADARRSGDARHARRPSSLVGSSRPGVSVRGAPARIGGAFEKAGRRGAVDDGARRTRPGRRRRRAGRPDDCPCPRRTSGWPVAAASPTASSVSHPSWRPSWTLLPALPPALPPAFPRLAAFSFFSRFICSSINAIMASSCFSKPTKSPTISSARSSGNHGIVRQPHREGLNDLLRVVQPERPQPGSHRPQRPAIRQRPPAGQLEGGRHQVARRQLFARKPAYVKLGPARAAPPRRPPSPRCGPRRPAPSTGAPGVHHDGDEAQFAVGVHRALPPACCRQRLRSAGCAPPCRSRRATGLRAATPASARSRRRSRRARPRRRSGGGPLAAVPASASVPADSSRRVDRSSRSATGPAKPRSRCSIMPGRADVSSPRRARSSWP